MLGMGDGLFEMEVFKDGVNADQFAEDYKREILEVDKNTKAVAEIAAGGWRTTLLSKK